MALHILDRLAIGIILLDGAARVLFANATARLLVTGGRSLSTRIPVVESFSAQSQRLSQLIQSVRHGAPTTAMTVPNTVDGHSLMLLVSSMHPREVVELGGGLRDATTIVFVCDLARPIDVTGAWVTAAYGLTTAEAKVAISASSGTTIGETAHQLGLSPNTVKTHLRKVFAKTGTSRQIELARLMASVALVRDAAPKSNTGGNGS